MGGGGLADTDGNGTKALRVPIYDLFFDSLVERAVVTAVQLFLRLPVLAFSGFFRGFSFLNHGSFGNRQRGNQQVNRNLWWCVPPNLTEHDPSAINRLGMAVLSKRCNMFKKLGFLAFIFSVSVAPVLPLHADGVLKTEFGAKMKVIVRNDCAVFAEPNESSRSQPVKQWDFYFVLPADASGAKQKNGFYRIASGTSDAQAIGWIKNDSVVEWNHSQCLGFAKRAERDPAHFFSTPQALEGYLKNGKTEEAISREPEGVETLGLMPILSEEKIKLKGEEIKSYKVGYIIDADPKNNTSSPSKALTVNQIQKDLTLDIVFVIDTTSSMKPYIEATKDVVRKISTAISDNKHVKGRVRLGLVGYRDRGDEYVTKILCSLEAGKDLQSYQAELAKVEASGGGDSPEQVYAGIDMAVSKMAWGATSYRHVVVIGDSANHADDKSMVSLESVLAKAQPAATSNDLNAVINHITIHSLQVGEGTGPEADLCRKQFQALAAGRSFAGVSANSNNLKTFEETLLKTLANRVESTEMAISGDKAIEADPKAGPLGAVLAYLGKEKIVGSGFASGYGCETDSKGNRTVEAYTLVSRNNLRAFRSAMEFYVTSLEGAGDPGSKDVEKILNSLKTLTVHLGYAEEIKANTPMKQVMELILGLPIKSPCFEMTPSRLASMSQKDFESWVAQISASHAVVDAHLEKASWFNLGRETKADHRFAFIRVSDLP